MKQCSKCGEKKSPDEFQKGRNQCKPCVYGAQREARLRNHDEYKRYIRDREFQRRLGISLEDYEAIMTDALCAICDDPAEALDHDHVSGQIRQPLCFRCNAGIGMFLESPDRMRKAIDYLEEYV